MGIKRMEYSRHRKLTLVLDIFDKNQNQKTFVEIFMSQIYHTIAMYCENLNEMGNKYFE